MARNPIQRQSVFDKPGRCHGGVVVQPAPRARVGAPQRCEGATVPGITRLSQLRRWLLGTWRKRGKVVKIHHFSAIGSTHMALLQWQLAFHPTCREFQSHHFYCILYFFLWRVSSFVTLLRSAHQMLAFSMLWSFCNLASGSSHANPNRER